MSGSDLLWCVHGALEKKTNTPNKPHFWAFIHNVTGNYKILGMQHNERKQGKEYCKFSKNMISKWPMTGIAAFHRAATMNFLLTPPEPGTDIEVLAFP